MNRVLNSVAEINELTRRAYTVPPKEAKEFLVARNGLIKELRRYCGRRGVRYENIIPLIEGYKPKIIYHNKIRSAKKHWEERRMCQ